MHFGDFSLTRRLLPGTALASAVASTSAFRPFAISSARDTVRAGWVRFACQGGRGIPIKDPRHEWIGVGEWRGPRRLIVQQRFGPSLSEHDFADPVADLVFVTGHEPSQINTIQFVACRSTQDFDAHQRFSASKQTVYAELMPEEIGAPGPTA
jgi:hypothetical protein